MVDDPHFRRSARRPVELTVRYRHDTAGARLQQSGKLVDLSMGGAQIKCERPPPTGIRVRIILTSPSAWDPLELPAEVRWLDGAEGTFGVAFDALRRAEAAALYELLSVSRFAEPKT